MAQITEGDAELYEHDTTSTDTRPSAGRTAEGKLNVRGGHRHARPVVLERDHA